MTPIPDRYRERIFTVAAALSFLSCITSLVLWNMSWEKPNHFSQLIRRWRVGAVEISDADNRLSIAFPTERELLFRQWYDYQQQTLESFPQSPPAATRRAGGPAQQNAARQHYDDQRRNFEAHNHHLQTEPVVDREVTVWLPLLTVLTAIFPLVWIGMLWRRKRDAVRSAWSRRIRWKKPEELAHGQRLFQRLFAVVSVVSLLLSLAAAFLWGRSYLSSDQRLSMQFVTGPGMLVRIVQWSTHRGGFLVGRHDNLTVGAPVVQPKDTSAVDWIEWRFNPDRPRPPRFHKLPPERVPGKAVYSYGFHYQQFPGNAGYMLVIPFWFLTIISAVMPALWLLIYWRRKQKPGHCTACDYDLTANTSGVCPECGTPVLARMVG